MTSVLLRDALLRSAGEHPSLPSPYRNDRVAWVHDCIRWRDGEAPTDYQDEILAALDTHGRVCVRGPHGIGKTALDAWVVLHFASTRDVEAVDWKNPTVASAWRQLTHFLWPEIRKWARRVDWSKVGRPPLALGRELLKLNLQLPTGEAFAVAVNDPASLEGAHADSLLYLLDECKTIPAETWDAIEGAFSGAGADTDVEAIALANSTPGAPAGRFYEIQARKPGYEDWHTIHVSLDDAMRAGRIAGEWVEQRARQWGRDSPQFKNRVLGDFAEDDARALIPLAWVEAAIERWREINDADAWPSRRMLSSIGVDVAREGQDRTVIAPRYGKAIPRLYEYRGLATTETTDRTDAIAGRLAGVWVTVDVVGIGAGVVDQLRERDYEVVPFNGGHSAHEWTDRSGEHSFVNKRSAAFWALREALDPVLGDGIAIPDDDELLGELVALRWTMTASGKIAVERKDETKKRIDRSPDKADAVSYAFWRERPVVVDSRTMTAPVPRRRHVDVGRVRW